MSIKKTKVDQKQDVSSKVENDNQMAPSPSEQMIPISDINKIVNDALEARSGGNSENIGKMIADAIREGNKENTEYSEFAYQDPDMIDKEDRLPEPRVFWSPVLMYVLGGDKVSGRPISCPFGPVKFLPEGSKRNQTGKEENIFIWSKYQCFSKKEERFLENHSLFGIRFFDRMADTMSIDVREATMVAKYHSGLKTTPFIELMSQAKRLGLPIIDDPVHMRMAIAQFIAKEHMKKVKNEADLLVRESAKDRMMIENKL